MKDISILLVEDVAINRFIVRQYLQRQPYLSVEEAASGLEALHKLKTHLFDMVLMDIRMPDMDGYEVAGAIRAMPDPVRSSIPIIALTANATAELSENKHLFNDVVIKPFNYQELYAKVLSHTANRREKDGAGKETDEQPATPVRYEDIEQSLAHDHRRVLNFYHITEKALTACHRQYVQAIEQQDAAAAGEAIHKLRMTLSALGLEELQQLLEQGRQHLLQTALSPDAQSALLSQVQKHVDKVLSSIASRRQQLQN